MPKPADMVEELEEIVDRTSLLDVLIGLELMCEEKAQWVESPESIGTPDKALARLWRRAGRACRKAADAAVDVAETGAPERASLSGARDALECQADYFPAYDRPAILAAGRSDPWTMLYALAWARAWRRDWREFPGLMVEHEQLDMAV